MKQLALGVLRGLAVIVLCNISTMRDAKAWTWTQGNQFVTGAFIGTCLSGDPAQDSQNVLQAKHAYFNLILSAPPSPLASVDYDYSGMKWALDMCAANSVSYLLYYNAPGRVPGGRPWPPGRPTDADLTSPHNDPLDPGNENITYYCCGGLTAAERNALYGYLVFDEPPG